MSPVIVSLQAEQPGQPQEQADADCGLFEGLFDSCSEAENTDANMPEAPPGSHEACI